MAVEELCYKIEEIPDLNLNKYTSLDGNGVDGVLEKHVTAKGIMMQIDNWSIYQ